MDEKNVPPSPELVGRKDLSVALDAAVIFVTGAAGGAGTALGAHLVNQVLDRPPRPEPPQIELPPGVPRD
jgi:hypothetical protein